MPFTCPAPCSPRTFWLCPVCLMLLVSWLFPLGLTIHWYRWWRVRPCMTPKKRLAQRAPNQTAKSFALQDRNSHAQQLCISSASHHGCLAYVSTSIMELLWKERVLADKCRGRVPSDAPLLWTTAGNGTLFRTFSSSGVFR